PIGLDQAAGVAPTGAYTQLRRQVVRKLFVDLETIAEIAPIAPAGAADESRYERQSLASLQNQAPRLREDIAVVRISGRGSDELMHVTCKRKLVIAAD